ncbi:MAG: hypothetical protein WBZ54_07950, partial [Methylocella sp.]
MSPPFGAKPSPLALIKAGREGPDRGYALCARARIRGSFAVDPGRFVHPVSLIMSVSPSPNGKFHKVTLAAARAHARAK